MLDPGEAYLLAFQGGFEPGLEDDTKTAMLLTLDYPVRDPEHVPSMDTYQRMRSTYSFE